MSDKYSLIIMRDSTQKVRRLRISTKRIKILLLSTVFLVLLGIGATAFSVYIIKEHSALIHENAQLKATLAEADMKLLSLQNMEQIYKDTEAVSTKAQSPLDTGPLPDAATADNSPLPANPNTLNATAVVANIFPGTVNATAENYSNSTALLAIDATRSPQSFQNATLLPPDEGGQGTDGSGAITAESPAKISNIDVKIRSPKTIRLAFDLNNAKPGVTLAGDATLKILTKTGEEFDVTVPKNDMDFQINKYKRMVTTFPLPDGQDLANIESLKINIIVNGTIRQTEVVNLPKTR